MAVRRLLIDQLRSPHAHATLRDALAGLPPEQRGARPAGQPHTPWRLLAHLRLAQWDIVEFSRGPEHVSPPFPDGYWPASDAPRAGEWEEAIAAYERDLDAFAALLADPAIPLLTPFPWGDGQTLMREAQLIADHNAYHVGQIVMLRQLLGSWPPQG